MFFDSLYLLPVIKHQEKLSIREIFIDHIKEKEVADLKTVIAELKNVITNKDQPSGKGHINVVDFLVKEGANREAKGHHFS